MAVYIGVYYGATDDDARPIAVTSDTEIVTDVAARILEMRRLDNKNTVITDDQRQRIDILRRIADPARFRREGQNA